MYNAINVKHYSYALALSVRNNGINRLQNSPAPILPPTYSTTKLSRRQERKWAAGS